jgi:acetate kinase
LLGLSGVSHDMRILLDSPKPRARLAVHYFIHRIAREIGALAASLGGLDGLVFTAGIGEHSPVIRARIVEACAWLGVTLDAQANERGGPRISAAGSEVWAWVIPTDEELMIARHTLQCFRKRPSVHPPPRPPIPPARPERRRRHSRAARRLGHNSRKESRS